MRVSQGARLNGGRGRLAALCLVFFAALIFAGCGGVKTPPPEDYFKVLERWSRGQKVYDGLEARLYMNATFKTADFRRAYMDRYARSYELGSEHLKALSEREIEQAEAFNEFFFTAYTPDESLNDFDREDTVWQMYIEDEAGNRARPISITTVDYSEHVIREFFPYFDLWSRAYTVKFPKYADGGGLIDPERGAVKLIVTGVMGKGELVWRPKK